MVSATAKLSSKAQTVLPRLVREELGLKPGDSVRFIIDNGTVTLLKNHSVDDDPFHTFTEWASQEDDDAYASL
jgi:antitoxin PrlF